MALSETAGSLDVLFKKKLSIHYYGNPVLRQKTGKIENLDGEIRSFAERMIDSMQKNNGIGLAAPQVGRSVRLITLDIGSHDNRDADLESSGERMLLPRMPLALVNPFVVRYFEEQSEDEEGCLSIPGIYAPVTRPVNVFLHAQLLNGESVHVECGNMLARCLQHEIDHLNGIMFVDRVKKHFFEEIRSELEELEKQNSAGC